jgi:hypothetical protein
MYIHNSINIKAKNRENGSNFYSFVLHIYREDPMGLSFVHLYRVLCNNCEGFNFIAPLNKH